MVVDLSRDGGEVGWWWWIRVGGVESKVGDADTAADLVPPKSGPMGPPIEHHEGEDRDQPATQNYEPRSKLDRYGKPTGQELPDLGG